MKRLAAAAACACAVVVAGCGTSHDVRTVTVTTPSAAKAVVAKAAAAPRSSSASTKTRPKHAKRSAATVDAFGFVSCDANIKAKAATTTCGFAQNAFWSYWRSGQSASLRVYSPATGKTFATTCTPGEGQVVCTTPDRGAVKFAQAAIDSYSASQAAAYARTHITHAPGSTATSPTPAESYTPPPAYTPPADTTPDTTAPFCETHDCIPNYPNGRGSTVQCADGSYSQSGGIQGACSHHGGVG